MKFEILFFGIIAFLMADIYYDGKYSKVLVSWKKYYQMGIVAFVGLSFYLFLKKNPKESQNMIQHANSIIKYMPIDKNAADMITPMLNFTNQPTPLSFSSVSNTPQHKRMMNSGINTTKRSVSETKKKYVASSQSWKCGYCNNQLDASFEVDHKIDLQDGGSNHVDNLIACCRNCHGKKTMSRNL